MDAWLSITVDMANPAAANFASSGDFGMGILFNVARLLERYADDRDVAQRMPRKVFRERVEAIGAVVVAGKPALPRITLPSDDHGHAVVELDGDSALLLVRPPELSAFAAIAVAGVLRTNAMLPAMGNMTAQVVAQVLQQVLQANAQAAEDQRIRELIARGGRSA